jgi:hypothetical protein
MDNESTNARQGAKKNELTFEQKVFILAKQEASTLTNELYDLIRVHYKRHIENTFLSFLTKVEKLRPKCPPVKL